MKEPLFSILIPSWNNLAFLKLCVASIRKNSTYAHEILIHVNDGSDGTRGIIKAGLKATYQFTLIAKIIEQRLRRELNES